MSGRQWSVRMFRLGTVPLAFCAQTTLVAPVLIANMLGGCASFSPDGGMSVVNSIIAPDLRNDALKVSTDEESTAARARVLRLLRSTLSPDAAVRVALLNNKGLQATYNELGIAEAIMVEASLPPNPTFSLSPISTPVELDIEARIVADVLALVTLPARAEIATDRFRQAQLRAAEETLRVGAETRRSYYRAVAVLQLVAALAQATSAAEAAAALGKRLGETGAMNKLDQAREDAFHADLVIQLAVARRRAASERERLIRVLGLSASDLAFKLPQTLPVLPSSPRTLVAVETEAIRRRIDLQIARIEADALAKSYGLTKATRFINLLEVSGVSRTQREGGVSGTGGGVEVDFQVPIFDFGEVRLRQAGEAYMQAVNRLTEKALNVRSEAREAYQSYRSSYDIAWHYGREVLPLRKIISDETMLRYGAMQIDVFSLLTEAQRRIAANIAAIEAQRDFWLATTDLDAAVVGGGVASSDNPPMTSPADTTANK
jgi:outer membrane protein TolC